jgi:hypothetical protein
MDERSRGEGGILRRVAIEKLRPNPFRRLDEYPILREKVDTLKQSIDTVGLWESIIGRTAGDGCIEIAFGHHRLEALRQMYPPDHQVRIIVRDLSDEDMLRLMANENRGEWGGSGWVEIETVRATIEAYANGLIELPPVPPKTPKGKLRHVSQPADLGPYTSASVAEFLGWTRRNYKGSTVRPNHATQVAFLAIDALEEGLIKPSDLIGLDLGHIHELVRGIRKIQRTQKKEAALQRKAAQEERKRAQQARTPRERQHREQSATRFDHQAQGAEIRGKTGAEKFRKEAVERFRNGNLSVHGARGLARSMTDPAMLRDKIHTVDDVAMRAGRRLNDFLEEDELAKDVRFVKANRNDLSDRMAEALLDCARSLQQRLERRILNGIAKQRTRTRQEGPPEPGQPGISTRQPKGLEGPEVV